VALVEKNSKNKETLRCLKCEEDNGRGGRKSPLMEKTTNPEETFIKCAICE
jgi:hypothetical protein